MHKKLWGGIEGGNEITFLLKHSQSTVQSHFFFFLVTGNQVKMTSKTLKLLMCVGFCVLYRLVAVLSHRSPAVVAPVASFSSFPLLLWYYWEWRSGRQSLSSVHSASLHLVPCASLMRVSFIVIQLIICVHYWSYDGCRCDMNLTRS